MKYLNLKFLFLFFALAVALPQAWAGTVTDVIDQSDTYSYLGTTSTSTWVTDFSVTEESGAEYTIHSMGLNKSNYAALRWNQNGFIIATRSGGKLVSVKVYGYDSLNKKVNVYASNTAYTGSPSGSYLSQLNLPSENSNPNYASYEFQILKSTNM